MSIYKVVEKFKLNCMDAYTALMPLNLYYALHLYILFNVQIGLCVSDVKPLIKKIKKFYTKF